MKTGRMQSRRLRKKLFKKLKRPIICKGTIPATRRSLKIKRKVRLVLSQQLLNSTKHHHQPRLSLQPLTRRKEMKQPSSAVNAKKSCLQNVRG